MPVNILYCEGTAKSPDVRVISAIISPGCVVRPIGSKQGLAQRILGGKDVRPGSMIAGLRDRDFDDDDSLPTGNPRNGFITDAAKQISLGWYWERKEIENYLIDPKVVKRSLGDNAPPASDYRLVLEQSAEKIAAYTAARITLFLYLSSRPSPPNNAWGEERDRKEGYCFPKNKGLTEVNCKAELNILSSNTNSELAHLDPIPPKNLSGCCLLVRLVVADFKIRTF